MMRFYFIGGKLFFYKVAVKVKFFFKLEFEV